MSNVIDTLVSDLKAKIEASEANTKECYRLADESEQETILLRAALAQLVPPEPGSLKGKCTAGTLFLGDGATAAPLAPVSCAPRASGHEDAKLVSDKPVQESKATTVLCHGDCGNARRFGYETCGEQECIKTVELKKGASQTVVVKKAKPSASKALDYLLSCEAKGGATLHNIALEMYGDSSQQRRTNASNLVAMLRREGLAVNNGRGLWRASGKARDAAAKDLEARSAFVGKGA